MSKIMLCTWKGKYGYKYGEEGYCCTFNKSKESREKAYNRALNVAEYKSANKV